MSKTGHAVTALALAAAAVAAPGERDAAHIVFAVGVLAGASGPDFLELVYGWRDGGWGRTGERLSLIPHRTLTHSPLLWAAVLAVALRCAPPEIGVLGAVVPLPLGALAGGFAAACLLHIAVDMLSPMGVPLLSPFGRRTSVGWSRNSAGRHHCYTTGALSEAPVIALVVAAAAGWCFAAHGVAAIEPIARL